MTATKACVRRLLAGGRSFRVEVCGCGMLHVTLGPVTLRLERQACEDLRATLDEAMCRLKLTGAMEVATPEEQVAPS